MSEPRTTGVAVAGATVSGLLDPQVAARRVAGGLARRYRAERMLRLAGALSLMIGLGFLVVLLSSITIQGLPALWQTHIALDIDFDADVLAPDGAVDELSLSRASYGRLIREALDREFPGESRRDRRDLYRLASTGAVFVLRDFVLSNPRGDRHAASGSGCPPTTRWTCW
jgi:phosphate transport system permease protein